MKHTPRKVMIQPQPQPQPQPMIHPQTVMVQPSAPILPMQQPVQPQPIVFVQRPVPVPAPQVIVVQQPMPVPAQVPNAQPLLNVQQQTQFQCRKCGITQNHNNRTRRVLQRGRTDIYCNGCHRQWINRRNGGGIGGAIVVFCCILFLIIIYGGGTQ